MEKYPTHSEVIKAFSPASCGYVMQNSEEALMLVDTPSIYDLTEKFGIEFATIWVRTHIMALFGSSSNKDKGVADGIKFFCEVFTPKLKRFKLVELMLFFGNYKAGMYDSSFSTFDARRIGNAFFEKFVPNLERKKGELVEIEEARKREERRFVPPEGYTSLSWYNELKKRAEHGDANAQAMLEPKSYNDLNA